MNPELQRRIWTDLTPRRLGFLVVVLGIVFAAAAFTGPRTDSLGTVSIVANTGFFLLAVLWGSRNAGESLAEDIRDRTWDLQRLSALTAWDLTWGKLIGSTMFVWVGSLICLVPIALNLALYGNMAVLNQPPQPAGLGSAVGSVFGLILSALIAQAGALYAVLIAARRQAGAARWSLVLAVGVGLILWNAAVFGQSMLSEFVKAGADDPLSGASIMWWGQKIPSQAFGLASLIVWLALFVTGSWRLMRRAVQMKPEPLWWLGIVCFVCLYAAGFAWTSRSLASEAWVNASVIIAAIAGSLAFATALVEPKDRANLRRAAAAIEQGRWAAAARDIPSFMWPLMISIVFAVISSALIAAGSATEIDQSPAHLAIVVLLFLIRDIGIVMFFCLGAKPGRGEFPAVVTIALLYGVGGIVGGTSGIVGLGTLFLPGTEAPAIIAIGAPLIEAVAIWVLTGVRFAEMRKAA